MANRAFAQEDVQPARNRAQRVGEPRRRLRTCAFRSQVARTRLKKPAEDAGREEAAIEQRGEAFAQPALAELDEHHRDVGIGSREVTADPK